MDEQDIESLANLLNRVINDSPLKFEITNSGHVSVYLEIFLRSLQNNNNEPVPYERFKEQLWSRIPSDRPLFREALEDFTIVWTAWVDLYQFLQSRNMLAS
jgi:hypothetical protein